MFNKYAINSISIKFEHFFTFANFSKVILQTPPQKALVGDIKVHINPEFRNIAGVGRVKLSEPTLNDHTYCNDAYRAI